MIYNVRSLLLTACLQLEGQHRSIGKSSASAQRAVAVRHRLIRFAQLNFCCYCRCWFCFCFCFYCCSGSCRLTYTARILNLIKLQIFTYRRVSSNAPVHLYVYALYVGRNISEQMVKREVWQTRVTSARITANLYYSGLLNFYVLTRLICLFVWHGVSLPSFHGKWHVASGICHTCSV